MALSPRPSPAVGLDLSQLLQEAGRLRAIFFVRVFCACLQPIQTAPRQRGAGLRRAQAVRVGRRLPHRPTSDGLLRCVCVCVRGGSACTRPGGRSAGGRVRNLRPISAPAFHPFASWLLGRDSVSRPSTLPPKQDWTHSQIESLP